MPIQLQDAIRRVRSLLEEPCAPTTPSSTAVPRMYSDTEITDWVNDGLRDLARRAEFLFTADSSITINAYGETPNQPVPTYPLLNDVWRIYRVEFQVAGDSSQIYPLEASNQNYMDNIWNIDQISSMSYPQYWMTRGYPGGTGRNKFVIQIFPQSSQAGNLNVFYYRQPVRLSDPVANPTVYDVTLDCQEGWDDMIVDYAYMKGLIKARDPQWQVAQQMYEAKMVNVIDTTRRYNDQPQFMQYDFQPMPWGFDGGGMW